MITGSDLPSRNYGSIKSQVGTAQKEGHPVSQHARVCFMCVFVFVSLCARLIMRHLEERNIKRCSGSDDTTMSRVYPRGLPFTYRAMSLKCLPDLVTSAISVAVDVLSLKVKQCHR